MQLCLLTQYVGARLHMYSALSKHWMEDGAWTDVPETALQQLDILWAGKPTAG